MVEHAMDVSSWLRKQLSRPAVSVPLDGGPDAFVTLDALVVDCHERPHVNVCVVHAVGVNPGGFRESLGSASHTT